MKRGGFIVSIPLLIVGAITAAKLAAGRAAMEAGGVAMDQAVNAIERSKGG